MIYKVDHTNPKDPIKCQESKYPPIFAQRAPSVSIEVLTGVALLNLSKDEGKVTPDGRIVVAYDADDDLPPSVAMVVRWLDENVDGYMTTKCALEIGMPHLQQLRISVQELIDHRIVKMIVEKGRAVFFLTDKGDLYAEELPDVAPKKWPVEPQLGGLFKE